MPIIFSALRNERDIIPTKEYVSAPYMVDKEINESNQFNDIQINTLRATLEGIKADDPRIIFEGYNDGVDDTVRWFKNWQSNWNTANKHLVDNLVELQYKSKVIAKKYERHATKFGDFYKNPNGFTIPTFTVKGFDYTIDSTRIDTAMISRIIVEANRALDNVAHDRNISTTTRDFVHNMSSTQAIDTFRGSIIHQGPVSAEQYPEALFRAFRNGQIVKKDIVCNTQKLYDFYRGIQSFKDIIAGCMEDRKLIEKQTHDIIACVQNGKPITGNAFVNGSIKNYKAVSLIITASNSAMKRALDICNRYEVAKIKATDEAIRFYSYCLSMALKEGETNAQH